MFRDVIDCSFKLIVFLCEHFAVAGFITRSDELFIDPIAASRNPSGSYCCK
jgi:hypothetical protein